MFEKILIANRGDQPGNGAAAQLNCMAHAVRAGDFTSMEKLYV
jgi:hypothetical protein